MLLMTAEEALLSALTSALGSAHGVYIYHWLSLAIQTVPGPYFFIELKVVSLIIWIPFPCLVPFDAL